MGYASARLFEWLQGAGFYVNLHLEAVAGLPSGVGGKGVDVGCGPGVLTRLAAAKGYNAVGIDMDPYMVSAAMKIAKAENSSAVFEVGDVFRIPAQSADVVSASSLLATLDDKVGGFQALLGAVRPGGSLLIVEPTDRMTAQAVNVLIENGFGGRRINGLRMWARARQGNAVDPEIFKTAEAKEVAFTPLLGGLVGAWLFEREC